MHANVCVTSNGVYFYCIEHFYKVLSSHWLILVLAIRCSLLFAKNITQLPYPIFLDTGDNTKQIQLLDSSFRNVGVDGFGNVEKLSRIPT
jgi:hypothetical protein